MKHERGREKTFLDFTQLNKRRYVRPTAAAAVVVLAAESISLAPKRGWREIRRLRFAFVCNERRTTIQLPRKFLHKKTFCDKKKELQQIKIISSKCASKLADSVDACPNDICLTVDKPFFASKLINYNRYLRGISYNSIGDYSKTYYLCARWWRNRPSPQLSLNFYF